MKSNQMLFCAMSLFFLFGFKHDATIDVEIPQSQSKECFYPSDLLRDLLNCPDCEGIRIYNALYPKNAGISLMAVSESKGSDVSGAFYNLFEIIKQDAPVIDALEKSQAEESCANLGEGNCFAVTINSETINNLLAENGATGISFIQTIDTNGNATLRANPAYLDKGIITPVSGAQSFTSEDPCPSSCGQNPTSSYVCKMTD